MLQHIRSQKGFSHIEVLLVLILISIISFAGYYVYTQNKDADTKPAAATEKTDAKKPSDATSLSKAYRNTDLGFGFKYPDGWKLTDDVETYDDGYSQGYATVMSPDGIEVSFSISTGKGGDCMDDPSDQPHNTLNCSTLEVLESEKVTLTDKTTAYLYRFKLTLARGDDGTVPKSEYGMYLDNRHSPSDYTAPIIGAIFGVGEVSGQDGVTVSTYVSGKNNTSMDLLSHADMQTAEAILKSLVFVK